MTGVKPEDLIAAFRNSYNPRIAVTVDMIATGTDIKPMEILLFMRHVKYGGCLSRCWGGARGSSAHRPAGGDAGGQAEDPFCDRGCGGRGGAPEIDRRRWTASGRCPSISCWKLSLGVGTMNFLPGRPAVPDAWQADRGAR